MTQEAIKAAVLAECERLCPIMRQVHVFSDMQASLIRVLDSDEQRVWEFLMSGHSYMIWSGMEDHATVRAYRLLGLNKPPADTKWERLKAEIVSRNEAEVEAIKSLPPIGLPQSVRDAAYATGHVLGWIQGIMTRIEQEESK